MSSSQVSSSDTQLSYKLKTSPTYNELQEVTCCTKETVRITPPLHDGTLRPTIMTFEGTPNGTLKKSTSSSVLKLDKECQTEVNSPSSINHVVSVDDSKRDFISVSAKHGNNIEDVNHIDVITDSVSIDMKDNFDKMPIRRKTDDWGDAEEDTCCVKCFLFTLRICDCCVLL